MSQLIHHKWELLHSKSKYSKFRFYITYVCFSNSHSLHIIIKQFRFVLKINYYEKRIY